MESAIEVRSLWKHYDGFCTQEPVPSLFRRIFHWLDRSHGSGKNNVHQTADELIRKDDGSIAIFGMDHLDQ